MDPQFLIISELILIAYLEFSTNFVLKEDKHIKTRLMLELFELMTVILLGFTLVFYYL